MPTHSDGPTCRIAMANHRDTAISLPANSSYSGPAASIFSLYFRGIRLKYLYSVVTASVVVVVVRHLTRLSCHVYCSW